MEDKIRLNQGLIKLVQLYKTPQDAARLLKETRAIFIVGISGAGKDTILKELLKTEKFHYIVSHTTRKPRENAGILEQNGVDYHFIDADNAELMLVNKEFVEAKLYSGSLYGTSIKEFETTRKEQKIAITDIEVQGVDEYAKISNNITPIFVLPPNYEIWQERLNSRYTGNTIDLSDVKSRLQTAKIELQQALNKDYYQFVINDDLSRTIRAIQEIANGNSSEAKNSEAKKAANQIVSSI